MSALAKRLDAVQNQLKSRAGNDCPCQNRVMWFNEYTGNKPELPSHCPRCGRKIRWMEVGFEWRELVVAFEERDFSDPATKNYPVTYDDLLKIA